MPAKTNRRYIYFIGIDISRNELDFVVRHNKEMVFHREIANEESAILTMLTEIKALPNFKISKAVFCFEFTGFYGNRLLTALKRYRANIAQEHPAHIRYSLGTMRGKSDKLDAVRIAEYAYRNREHLKLHEPKRVVLQQLTHLSSLRNRLVTTQAGLSTPLDEQDAFVKDTLAKESRQLCSGTLTAIKADIEAVDGRILQVIKADERLHHLFKIITSVPHIGTITAVHILICTNEYRDICSAKKFACYAGIAPFPNESGIVQRRREVSVISNRKMKSLLHICAISAIGKSTEHKAYYQRKVAEGKNKMLVLNAVRFKLISRVFACLKEDRPFVSVKPHKAVEMSGLNKGDTHSI